MQAVVGRIVGVVGVGDECRALTRAAEQVFFRQRVAREGICRRKALRE